LIDPLEQYAEEYVRVAEMHGLTISKALDTHSHADHFSALRRMDNLTGVELLMSEFAIASFHFTPIRDREMMKIGNLPVQVIYTPGHTSDHVALDVAHRLLLSGDSLLVGGVARPDLILSDEDDVRARAGQLYESINSLMTFEDYFELYPGHFAGSSCGAGLGHKPNSTIGYERRFNSALQRKDRAEFVDFVVNTTYNPIPDYQLIKKYNLGLIDRPDIHRRA